MRYTRIDPNVHRGFTLVELILVITITGIIAGMVSVFIRRPVESYFDSVRRAGLTDLSDTVARLVARDVNLALPNSLRNPTDNDTSCLEFIPTKSGARYRASPDSSGVGDALDFTTIDGSFDILGLNSDWPSTNQIADGDIVVVLNTESCDTTGCTGNAYRGSNAIKVATGGVTASAVAGSSRINLVDAVTGAPFQRKQLPNPSPYYRFQVIPSDEHVVAYVCRGTPGIDASGNGGQTLYRYHRTLTSAWSRPNTCGDMWAGATESTLATGISSCTLRYEPPGSSTGLGNNGILAFALEITEANESVRLYQQIQVNNSP
jgi:MSHA biogenesis protein MshO